MEETRNRIAEVAVGSWLEKTRAYGELLKFRLSTFVVLSALFGYALAVREVDWLKMLLLTIAGFAITGASNIINQIIEKDWDGLMRRTAGRPLPTGRVSVREAEVLVIVLTLLSVFIFVNFFNNKTALVALLSLVLYGFVYTPLKRVGPISVFVGAFPGAFPPMIGWLAATNQFGWEPGVLFAIQFFWQFPHFWAIAWVADEDYKRAGFKMLPNGGSKGVRTVMTIMIYTLFLLPVGWLPYALGMTGIYSALVATGCGVLFLAQTFHLMRHTSDRAALLMMFGSFVYLPTVQIAFLLDKIPL
ncbi:MAG: heme o synthase [Cytophagaceae bacterium]|nr:heme o synthase [Cytophagaceae bacterium]